MARVALGVLAFALALVSSGARAEAFGGSLTIRAPASLNVVTPAGAAGGEFARLLNMPRAGETGVVLEGEFKRLVNSKPVTFTGARYVSADSIAGLAKTAAKRLGPVALAFAVIPFAWDAVQGWRKPEEALSYPAGAWGTSPSQTWPDPMTACAAVAASYGYGGPYSVSPQYEPDWAGGGLSGYGCSGNGSYVGLLRRWVSCDEGWTYNPDTGSCRALTWEPVDDAALLGKIKDELEAGGFPRKFDQVKKLIEVAGMLKDLLEAAGPVKGTGGPPNGPKSTETTEWDEPDGHHRRRIERDPEWDYNPDTDEIDGTEHTIDEHEKPDGTKDKDEKWKKDDRDPEDLDPPREDSWCDRHPNSWICKDYEPPDKDPEDTDPCELHPDSAMCQPPRDFCEEHPDSAMCQPPQDFCDEHPDSAMCQPPADCETNPESPACKDFCEEHPDVVACQKLDEPDDEPLQTSERSVAFQSEWTEAGTCPAPITRGLHNGASVTWEFEPMCEMARGARPAIVGLALLSAALFIFGFIRSK